MYRFKFPMTKYNLKFLYRVIYKDGTHYDQNTKDISVADETKSCYYDVRLNDVAYFILSDGLSSWMLDLNDGGFSINGSPKFYLTTEQLVDFKLQHYRRVTMHLEGDSKTMTVNYVLGYIAKNLQGDPVSHHIIIK